MQKEIIITTDGSHSVTIPEMGVTYHSTHGAIQESVHVFIESGLRYVSERFKDPSLLSVFEMGFGTGLNALLTLIEAEKSQQKIYYETIELYPLASSMFSCLNYCEQLNKPGFKKYFSQMHKCAWDTSIDITPYFSFKKKQTSLADFTANYQFNIIYFDAFAPDVQPDLWTNAIFTKLYAMMKTSAVLTTYCSKSIVRKAMTEAGLRVEKIPGPPHKREIVRAIK